MDIEKYMLPCMSQKYLGIECLGCGTQRAFVLILNGEFTDAFFMYPPIYSLILFFGFVLLHFIDKSRNYHKIMIGLAIANASIMIANYLYKNF